MRTRWGLVAVLFCVGLLAAMQFIKVSLTLEDLAAHYGRPLETVSFLVSLVSLMGILFGVVAGAIVARLGTRVVILWALVAGAVLSVLQVALPPFWAMIGLRALEGASHLALVVAVPPVMASVATDRDRPIVMALWAMFFGVAFSLAALVFPTLLAAGGMPLLFGLHGAGLLALAAVLFALLPPGEPAPRPITYFAAHREIYTSPPIRAPGLIFVFYTLMFLAAVTFVPEALGRPELAGILPLVSLGGTLFAGVVGRYLAPDRVMILGYICLAAGAVPLFWGGVWSSYLMFIGMGLVPGACFAAIPFWNPTAADRALSTGAIAQMGNVGTGVGTPLFAVVLGLAGVAGLIWVLLLLSLAGLAMVLALRGGVLRA